MARKREPHSYSLDPQTHPRLEQLARETEEKIGFNFYPSNVIDTLAMNATPEQIVELVGERVNRLDCSGNDNSESPGR
jgi:hypothetical protein